MYKREAAKRAGAGDRAARRSRGVWEDPAEGLRVELAEVTPPPVVAGPYLEGGGAVRDDKVVAGAGVLGVVAQQVEEDVGHLFLLGGVGF